MCLFEFVCVRSDGAPFNDSAEQQVFPMQCTSLMLTEVHPCYDCEWRLLLMRSLVHVKYNRVCVCVCVPSVVAPFWTLCGWHMGTASVYNDVDVEMITRKLVEFENTCNGVDGLLRLKFGAVIVNVNVQCC